MGKCENCNAESEVKSYVVNDSLGRRFRKLCPKCVDDLRNNPEVILEIENEQTGDYEVVSNQDTAKNPTSRKMSLLYKALSIILGIGGFIAGIVVGDCYPAIDIDYKYPLIQSGEILTEKFNVPLMLYIWGGTAFLFFLFWGVYCILKNQEMILKNTEKKSEDNQ